MTSKKGNALEQTRGRVQTALWSRLGHRRVVRYSFVDRGRGRSRVDGQDWDTDKRMRTGRHITLARRGVVKR